MENADRDGVMGSEGKKKISLTMLQIEDKI